MVTQEGSLEETNAELGVILLRMCFEAYMVIKEGAMGSWILMEKECGGEVEDHLLCVRGDSETLDRVMSAH